MSNSRLKILVQNVLHLLTKVRWCTCFQGWVCILREYGMVGIVSILPVSLGSRESDTETTYSSNQNTVTLIVPFA